MPARLNQNALARVHQNDGKLRVGRSGRHVPGVLLVAGRVGDDEFAPIRRKESISNVDRDPLLALGLEPIHQKSKVNVAAGRAVFSRILLQRGQMILEQQLGIVEQAPDKRGLAVVHAPACQKAQKRLSFLLRQIGRKRAGGARHQK